MQSSDRSRWMRSDAILRGRFPLRRAPRPQWRGGRKNDTPSNGRMRSPRRSVRENTRRRSAVRRGHEVVPSRTPPSRRSHVLHATPRCRRRRPRRRRAAWQPDRALLEGERAWGGGGDGGGDGGDGGDGDGEGAGGLAGVSGGSMWRRGRRAAKRGLVAASAASAAAAARAAAAATARRPLAARQMADRRSAHGTSTHPSCRSPRRRRGRLHDRRAGRAADALPAVHPIWLVQPPGKLEGGTIDPASPPPVFPAAKWLVAAVSRSSPPLSIASCGGLTSCRAPRVDEHTALRISPKLSENNSLASAGVAAHLR